MQLAPNPWTNEQCSRIKPSEYGVSEEECWEKCCNEDACNAVNYRANQNKCKMYTCPIPLPVPNGTSENGKGYYKQGERLESMPLFVNSLQYLGYALQFHEPSIVKISQ